MKLSPHFIHLVRDKYERLEYLFALIGTVVVSAIAMGMLLHIVHRGYPL